MIIPNLFGVAVCLVEVILNMVFNPILVLMIALF